MFIRYASAITSGTFMTLTLFYIMQMLITMDPFDPIEPREPGILDWAPPVVEEVLNTEEPRPERLLPKVEPTPREPVTVPDGPKTGVKLPPAPTPPGPSTTLGGWMQDGPLVAIVRVEPTYPVRAAESDLEGYVTVSFDVSADGTVSNIKVVSSSHRIFEKAAIKAASKFRYKARVVDGIAQATYGLQNRFVFKMERG